jgi:hypothetical protein
MISDFFDVMISSLDQLAGALAGIGEYLLGVITDLIGTIIPFVGHLMDAKGMIVGWGKVAKMSYGRYDIGKRAYAIDFGTPKAAFAALETCMDQELVQQSLMATNATLTFAAKTGAAFADGGAATGTAIGIVSALAEFARQLYQLAAEWKATKKVKEALRNPAGLDLTVFKTYPLMGCYMLTSATLSDIIPIECFGVPGWMDAIEKSKKDDVDKILKKAEKLISASPFEFTNLPKRAADAGQNRNVTGFAMNMVMPVVKKV